MKINFYGNYNSTNYFEAGLNGLYQVLLQNKGFINWQLQDNVLTINWQDFQNQFTQLLNNIYQPNSEGLLVFGAKKQIFLQQGLLNTTLTIPATRKTTDFIELKVSTKAGLVNYSLLGLKSTVYETFAKEFFTPKGNFKKSVNLKSWLLPNSCGGFEVIPEVAVALAFAPTNWVICKIEKTYSYTDKKRYSYALISPQFVDFNFRLFRSPNLEDYVFSNLEDAVYYWSHLNNRQSFHGYEFFRKTTNRAPQIIKAVDLIADEQYSYFANCLPNKVFRKAENEFRIYPNPLRGLIATNLSRNTPWYMNLADNLSFDELRYQKAAIRKLLGGSYYS